MVRVMSMKVSSPTRLTSASNSPLPVSAKYMMMSVSGWPLSSMGTKDSPFFLTVTAPTEKG